MKQYRCQYCGNILEAIEDSGVVPVCCGVMMEEMDSSENDSGLEEKHAPVVRIKLYSCAEKTFNKVSVFVGDQLHPATTTHFIQWIELETDRGRIIKYLKPQDKPCVKFYTDSTEKVLAVYAYCNIHGLWKTVVD